MDFSTTIRYCRPQKGTRHPASLHAQLPASSFELIVKLLTWVRAGMAWALLIQGYDPGSWVGCGVRSELVTGATG